MDEFSAKALFAKIHKAEEAEEILESYQRIPIQLIKITKNGHLKLCREGEAYLKQIHGRIATVGVCGPIHSGKSSLLNLLINNSGEGFQICHKATERQEGIWIWGEPIKTKENSILFLDCEGTKQVERSTKQDSKIFAIMVLLASTFIYNSKGVIDENCISQLAFGTCFKEMIDYQTGYADSKIEIDERIAAETPKFIWVLRDFNLAITDDNGNSISPNEYMENLLNMTSFMGKNGEKNNHMRELILSTFKNRECVTLSRPLTHEKDLESFHQLSLSDLRPAFQQAFELFKINVLETCPSKKISDLYVTGFQLSVLLKEFLKIMNEGEIPNLYAVWDYAIRIQYEEVFNNAKDVYMENKNIDPSLMPFDEKELLEKIQLAKDQALLLLSDMTEKNEDLHMETIENLQDFFNEDLKFILKSNFAASEAFNLSLIENLYRSLIIKIDEGCYAGEFDEMESDWIKVMRQYEKEAKGPAKFIAISEFSRNHQHSAFAKFFQEIYDKYKEELEILRYKDKESQEKLNSQKNDEERKRIVDEYVRLMQINQIQEELNVEDNQLEVVLENVEKEVLRNL